MPGRMRPPRPGWRLSRPRGAAIIVALLAVALVAGIASAILLRLEAGIERSSGRRDHAQARQLALSAIDHARLLLAADGAATRIDWLGEAWADVHEPALHPAARIRLTIADASGDPDLNGLIAELHGAVPAGPGGSPVRRAASNGPAPFIARINLNTAPAQTLRAALPGLSSTQAAAVADALKARPADGLSALADRLPDGVDLPDPRFVATSSDHFIADAVVEHGVSIFRLRALLRRGEAGVAVVAFDLP